MGHHFNDILHTFVIEIRYIYQKKKKIIGIISKIFFIF